MHAKDIMTSPVLSVVPDSPILEAIRIMAFYSPADDAVQSKTAEVISKVRAASPQTQRAL
jgi:predicted transcriptional regulator